jgi:hypothetical protein
MAPCPVSRQVRYGWRIHKIRIYPCGRAMSNQRVGCSSAFRQQYRSLDGTSYRTWHEGPLLRKGLRYHPEASGRETDLRFYSGLCRAANRGRQQTTRLPFEAAPAMVVLMAYTIEERQLWVTSPSRRNNATRNRRTLPRREALPRQSPSKTATAIPSRPWRRAGSSAPDGRCPKRGHPRCSLPHVKCRTLLRSLARVRQVRAGCL